MIICLDLETTGLDPKQDRIIEIAAIKFDEQAEQSEAFIDTFSTLVNPGIPLSETIKLITGITDEDLLGAPSIQTVLPKLKEFVGENPVLGHNVVFDVGFLQQAGMKFGTLYDTYDLIRVLLPTAASYSLDVIGAKWDILHSPAHRALSDAKTTVSLWKILLDEMASLPKETVEKLEILFQKSAWPYSRFFSAKKILKKSGIKRMPTEDIPRFATSQKRENLHAEILESWFSGEKILYETDKIFSLPPNSKTVIVSPFLESEAVHPPKHYLSSEKLDLFLREKPLFTNEEVSFFARIILWKQKTLTGLAHELSFRGEEWSYWSLISGEGDFFNRALEFCKNKKIIFCPTSTLVSEEFKPLFDNVNIMVEEALHLEDRLTFALEEKYALYHFETYFKLLEELAETSQKEQIKKRKHALELLYGFFGLYYEKNKDPLWGGDVLIEEQSFPQSPEGKRIMAALEGYKELLESWPKNSSKLYQHIANFLIQKINQLLALFLRRKNGSAMGSALWISLYRETVTVHAAPIDIKPFLKPVLDSAKGFLMVDPAISLHGDYSFLKTMLGLSDQWKFIKDASASLKNLQFEIPKNLPEPNSEGYFEKSSAIMEETLRDHPNRLLMIFNSQRALEAYYQKILPFAIAKNITLLASKITGGLGKVVELFLQNPENSVLMGTQVLVRDLERIAPELQCIIFQKLPFDFSFSPLAKERPKLFKDGYHNYTLPRGLLKFKHFLYRWHSFQGEKKLVLLDTRIITREYGQSFMKDIVKT